MRLEKDLQKIRRAFCEGSGTLTKAMVREASDREHFWIIHAIERMAGKHVDFIFATARNSSTEGEPTERIRTIQDAQHEPNSWMHSEKGRKH